MYQVDDIKAQASGKWFGILKEFGIDVDERGNHGPCPLCGGVDRFRMDRDGSGYYCSQCRPGDSIKLIEKKTGLGFPEILERIAKMVGVIDPFTNTQPKKDPSIALKAVWKESSPIQEGDFVYQYLKSRGISNILPDNIRFCPECYNSDTKTKMPAMLSVFSNKHGRPISLHRTYLEDGKKADVPKPKKMLAGIEPLAGGAVRLARCNDCLGIAEGVETALSAMVLSGIPTWAALSATLLEAFIPPEGVKKITVFADNDKNFVGQKSAYVLANKLVNNPFGLEVEVFVPRSVGDYNDELIELGKEGGDEQCIV